LLIAFWGVLALISVSFSSRIAWWWLLVLSDLAAAILVCALAWISARTSSGLLRWMHDWNAFPLVIFTYKNIYFLTGQIRQGKDYDHLLIALDKYLFQVNPTEWLARISNPFLTELLQIAYSLFYVFFLAVGIELYRKTDFSKFRYFRFTVVYGFFISYLGYFLMPAVGPRFTLHDFSKINIELPGLFFTPALRWFIDFCESIPSGASNSLAYARTQRDVFPSGHTMLTLVAIVLAYKYKTKVRHYLLIIGMLLVFATVYLRYHYLVDIFAGILLALPCLITAERFYAFMRGNPQRASPAEN